MRINRLNLLQGGGRDGILKNKYARASAKLIERADATRKVNGVSGRGASPVIYCSCVPFQRLITVLFVRFTQQFNTWLEVQASSSPAFFFFKFFFFFFFF